MNFMQDMTKGSPLRLLVSFSIPLLIGSLFQQFYTMADSIIVGKFVGADALASIGACSSVIYLLFSLFFGLSAGIGIVISQYFGAGDGSAVRRGIACSVYLLAAASLLLTLIGLVFARPILTILGTPSGDHGGRCRLFSDHQCRACSRGVLQRDLLCPPGSGGQQDAPHLPGAGSASERRA